MKKEYREKTKANKEIKIACYIAISISAILLIPYFIFFHYGFSNDSNSWSNFGDYFNGVLSPILTAVNIYVFIRLTTTISDIESKRAQETLTQEKLRSEKELKQAKELFEKKAEYDKIRFEREHDNERRLLLMQLRKQELDIFVKQMNRFDDYTSNENGIESLRQLTYYLQAFLKTGLRWFEIDKESRIATEIRILWKDLQKYIYNIENNKEFDENLFYKIYDARDNIINALAESTINKI